MVISNGAIISEVIKARKKLEKKVIIQKLSICIQLNQ